MTNLTKQQFGQILKDTKILCELEPFVKKWSFDEILPNLEIQVPTFGDNHIPLTDILRAVKLKAASGDNYDEHVVGVFLRKIKDEIMVPKGNIADKGDLDVFEKSVDSTLLVDQYDHELEKTLKALEKIDDVKTEAVTQTDIDDYIRGLGGKPDGVDLERTNIREWKNIFLEHFLDLNSFNYLAMKNVTTIDSQNSIKQRETLPNIRRQFIIKQDRQKGMPRIEKNADHFTECTSSRANVDSYFMTRKERKNMGTSFNHHKARAQGKRNDGLQPPTSLPFLLAEDNRRETEIMTASATEKSLWVLQKEHHETSLPQRLNEKRANSAMIKEGAPPQKEPQLNEFVVCKDNFYDGGEKHTKAVIHSKHIYDVKFQADMTRKENNIGQIHNLKAGKAKASVRPSSAVPDFNPIPVGKRRLQVFAMKGSTT